MLHKVTAGGRIIHMEDKEIIGILDGLISKRVNESEIIEYKTNLFDKEMFGKYISALSNSAALLDEKRAYIFWGIEDGTFNVVGTSFEPFNCKLNGSNELLIPWLTKMTGDFEFEFRKIEYRGKNIIVLLIPAARWVETKFKGIAYIRIESQTTTLDKYPDKKRLLWKKLVQETFEEGNAATAKTEKDVLDLLDYASYYKFLNKRIPGNNRDIITMLLSEGCITNELSVSSVYNITNLGALLFAKNLEDFHGLSNKAIRIIKYKGINRLEAESDFTFPEGYACGFPRLLNVVKNMLPKKEVFENGIRTLRYAYPEIVLRELIPNALIHQDFMIKGQQPRIEIFDDRIEITNAGEPLIPTNRFLDMTPISRNEALARMMHKLRICEERGSGIDRVLDAIEKNKMPALVIKSEHSSVISSVYLYKSWNQLTKEDKINLCYQHCCYLFYLEQKVMTNQSLRERFNVKDMNHAVISRVISDTRKEGLIKGTAENAKKYIPFWA